MGLSAIFSVIHFIAAFGVVSTVVFEKIIYRQELTHREAKLLQKVDGAYGASAITVLIIGFLRVVYFEKGYEYYFSNLWFWVKIGAFIAVGILSVYPTLRFLEWTNLLKTEGVPKINDKEYSRVKMIMNLELLGLLIMTASAAMMARGMRF